MMVDTNALSAFFDGERGVVRQIQSAERLYLPVIVLGEYRYGLLGSRERRVREARLVEMSKHCEVCPVLESTTMVYARIKSQLKKAGTPIPENDIWIAAISLQRGQVILSDDRHFDQIEGIQRQGW